MDLDQVKQPLSQFVEKASKSIKVDEVIIFGSYLEGNATEDSDIDVFIISDDFQKMAFENRLNILDRAADGIRPIVQAWGHTSEELKLASHLTLLGYARDNGIHYTPSKI